MTTDALSDALGQPLPDDATWLVYREHGDLWPLELLTFEESTLSTLPRFGHFFSRSAWQECYAMVFQEIQFVDDPEAPNYWPTDDGYAWAGEGGYGGYLRARDVRQVQDHEMWEELYEELWPVWERVETDGSRDASVAAFLDGADPSALALRTGDENFTGLSKLPGVEIVTTYETGEGTVMHLLRVVDDAAA